MAPPSFLAVLALAALQAVPPVQDEITFPVLERRLENGLLLLMAPDSTLPLVSCQVFYRAGSRNEHTGITGMAHLFEHMMFNGAKRYGPREFDRSLEAAGGIGNAFTTMDYTAYHQEVPPGSLEVVLDLESDRMENLRIDEEVLANEMEVVREERRMRLEDRPEGLAGEVLRAQVFLSHPYRWPVLGWMSDLHAIDAEDCRRFFQRYYHPGNAVLVLAGDLDPEKAAASVERWFGQIPRGPEPPAVRTFDAPRRHETRTVVRREAEAPLLLLGFQGPPAASPDVAALDLARQVLVGGESGRLVRRLVREEALALDVDLEHGPHIDPGPLAVHVRLRPGGAVARAEAVVWEELERLRSEPVEEAELERARTALVASRMRALSTLHGRALMLGRFQMVTGDWRDLFALPSRDRAVTAGQVQEAAQRHFRREVSTTVVLEPQPAGGAR